MQAIATLTMNPTVDLSAEVDQVIADRKLRCEHERREPGGGGINVARAIGKLGGTALAVYASGGLMGEELGRLLDREGVPRRPVPISDDTRENVFILETTSGRHFRFGMPGPDMSRDEVQGCFDALANLQPVPAYVVLSGSLPASVPADFYARLAAEMKRRGSKVVVDTSYEALAHAAKAGVFLLKPNQRELELLSGIKSVDGEGLERAARAIVESGGAEAVLASMGRAGALLVTAQSCHEILPPPVTLVSKIGAGDSTVGGLVLKLAEGWPLEEAARFGVASGSAAVMTPGTELCRKEDAERIYAQMKARRAA